MSKDKDDNIINILDKSIKEDAQYSDESFEYDEVDLSLQELTEEVDSLRAHMKQLSFTIMDLERARKEDKRLLELLYNLVLADKSL
jgi:hypothetical protein